MIWNGVPLGFDCRTGKPVAYNADDDGSGNAPTLIFGPMGSRKTVGLVMTQLLDEPGKRSFIVLDGKSGEVTAVTANYRRKVCGEENVKIVNSYGLLVKERPDLKSDQWNPLNDLEPGSITFADDCLAKGDSLIKTTSNESAPFFPDAGRSGVTAVIMWNVKEADRLGAIRSLPNVRATLTLEAEALKAVVAKMTASKDFDILTRARKFLDDNREIEGIKSTVETQTGWMNEVMRKDMETRGGVDFRACTQRPTTIYVILPVDELGRKATYLRLVLASALRALYRPGGVPTTILIEEGFILGHHAEIEQALSALRGFGGRITIVFQSLQQIKKLYPDTWGLFTAGAVLGFRPADLETAEWMTKKAGKVVVPVLSAADPSSPNDFGVRPSWQQKERERIPVDKMSGMPQGQALVWTPHRGTPRIVRVKGYFEIPELNARADANPYYKGGKVAPKPKGRRTKVWFALGVVGAGLCFWPHEKPVPRAVLISKPAPAMHHAKHLHPAGAGAGRMNVITRRYAPQSANGNSANDNLRQRRAAAA